MYNFLKHKQDISIFLLLIMFIGIIPVEVFAINDDNNEVHSNMLREDIFIYEDGEQKILIGIKEGVDIIEIPDQVEIIRKSALRDKKIKKLKLNENLIEIEEEAFANNQILGDVVLPSTLEKIGDRAFADNLIQKVDFSKTFNIQLGSSVFQDNKISGELDLSNLMNIPRQAFWNNEITNIIFDKEVYSIDDEAFANNKLSELNIASKNVVLGKNVFAGNGRYIIITSDTVNSERSLSHNYGHIVNPVNIKVRFLEKKLTGSTHIKRGKYIEFDPLNPDNFFSLNKESYYTPDYIPGYTISSEYKDKDNISFIPDKDGYVLDVYYDKNPDPVIKLNKNNLKKLVNSKNEGDDINREDLKSLVSAFNHLGKDITNEVKIYPDKLENLEAKEYEVRYSVADKDGRTSEYLVILPIALDPYNIKIGSTEWVLGDFLYEGNAVYGFTKKGLEKSSLVDNYTAPHINPETLEPITILNFKRAYSPDIDWNKPFYFSNPDVLEVIEDGGLIFRNYPEIPDMQNLKYLGSRISYNNTPGDPFPNLPNIEYIGDEAFSDSKLSGSLSDMPKLEYIGRRAFANTKIDGLFPNLPNIEYIRLEAFDNSTISGQLPDMPELINLQGSAFKNSNISGKLPDMPKLEMIGRQPFENTKVLNKDNVSLTQQLAYMPNLAVINEKAFFNMNLVGPLPDMPNIEYILENAFNGTNISGELPYMPKIKTVGAYAFKNTKLTGPLNIGETVENIDVEAFLNTNLNGELPELPKLRRFGDSALKGTDLSGSLPDMPNLEFIGSDPWAGTNIGGEIPDMPKIKIIGSYAFKNSGFYGAIPDLTNVEVIGDNAFNNNNLTGTVSDLPNLRKIGSNGLGSKNISGSLTDLSSVTDISYYAFHGSNISGPLTDMPKLFRLGHNAFNSKMTHDVPIYISAKADIKAKSFEDSYDSFPQVLLTYNEEDAPKVAESEFHILNPKYVSFTGKDSKGNVIIVKEKAVVEQSGDKLMLYVPYIKDYIDYKRIPISDEDLANGDYVHIYETYQEVLDNQGGNKYQFEIETITPEGLYEDNELINTFINFSTANEEVLENGRIVVEYGSALKDFFVQDIQGVQDVIYGRNRIEIILEKNLLMGTEMGIPLIFKTNSGSLEKLENVNAILFDGNIPKGKYTVKYGPKHVEPIFKSTFDQKKQKDIFINHILTENEIKHKTQMSFTVYPELEKFSRDFVDIKVKYIMDPFERRGGEMHYPYVSNVSKEWIQEVPGVYSYSLENFSGNPQLPRMVVNVYDPKNGLMKINMNVIVEGRYKDVDGNLQSFTMTDKNTVEALFEERPGEGFVKKISTPHQNNRHSYFYDNINERSGEFEWDLVYNIDKDLKEFTIIDYGLDKRMRYEAVEPNNRRALLIAYDEQNQVLVSTNISERYDFDDNIKDKIAKIELKYAQLRKDEVQIYPKVITKIKDPTINYYEKDNKNSVNQFKNSMSIEGITVEDKKIWGEDFAVTNVVEDNKSLASQAFVVPEALTLSYGKVAKSRFGLKSKEYFDKNLSDFDYTILINPGHIVQDVIIKNDLLATYDIKKTANGYTKIELNFKDVDVKINNKYSFFDLVNVETTPINHKQEKLEVHGLLSGSSEYELFDIGRGTLEGINLSNYSYDKNSEKMINGRFFSIQQSIVKDGEVAQKITTEPGDKFYYRFNIVNATNTIKENFELINILPFKGDFNGSAYRNNISLNESIDLPAGFKIEYLNQDSDLIVSREIIFAQLNDAAWSSAPSKNTKAIKITADKVDEDQLIQIDIPMITNPNLEEKDNSTVNINQFVYKHKELGYNQAFSNPVYQNTKVVVPTRDIKLTKVSHYMGEKDGVIEDITFVLRDSKGKLVDMGKTDENGELVFKDIPVNHYTLNERFAKTGYKIDSNKINITSKDMMSVKETLDLGEIVNNRIDEFDFLLRNVEVLSDISNLSYSNLKNIYSRGIKGGSFVVKNIDTEKSINVNINDRFGEKITLNPGRYIVEQTVAPEDNGLVYEENKIKYIFEINKFGKLYLSQGKGDSLEDKVEQQSNLVLFPNTIHYPLSKIHVLKHNQNGEVLPGAEFALTNIASGEISVGTSGLDGTYVFNDIAPGLYSLKEIKAPNGYISSNQLEMIEVPLDKSVEFKYKFVNKKLSVNVNKYKVIAGNVPTKNEAEEIAKSTVSSTGGSVLIKEIDNYYQVREVWKDNTININGTNFKTDSNGSTLNIQEVLNIDKDSILNISNNTKIPGHHESSKLTAYVEDYTMKEDFDGVIDIDIIVSPSKGSIYVSKYLLDNNNKVDNKEVNGSEYDLYVDKGNGYELLNSKTIENNNYLLFKDLDPNFNYKVVETFTPEGQLEANPKEYEVILRDDKSYVETVIFRNYIELEAGSVHLNKIDGRTEEVLEGVEFELIDKHGVGVKYTTDPQGNMTFEDLRYDLAPYTIKETKAAPGYRISSQTITVTEEDILNEEIFTVKNYKYNETPKTGTSGKLPYFLLSIPLIVLAYVFRKKKY